MRAPGRAVLGLALLTGLSVAGVGIALAASVQDLVTLTTNPVYGNFTCPPPSATEQTCDRGILRTWPYALRAVITPASGTAKTLFTQANTTSAVPATGLDPQSRDWMTDMHALACGNPTGVAAYVDTVGNLTQNGFGPPMTVGNCQFNGSFVANSFTPGGRWTVGSSVIPPPSSPPSPTPGPTATPTPSPKPTPKPTPKATPTPTSTPTSAPASAAPSASPSPSPSSSPSASESPSAAPTETPSAAPSSPVTATPSSSTPAGAGQATPESPAGAPAGATPSPGPTDPPTFSDSVLGIEDVNSDGGAVGGSLLLALILLLIIGFIAELFNNTVENNYPVIAGWFRKGPFGWISRARDRIRIDPPGRPGVLVFIALTALISAFVDPGFGLNHRSIAVFLGFLVGLIVVLASFKLPPILARRRKTGEMAQLRPLPWALVIAALFVLISRIAHLQPGYLYGIVLGAIFVSNVSDRDEGRETFYGSLWTLVAAVLAWIALMWLRGLGLPSDGFGVTLLSTAFAATLVAGLEAAAFALMPMRFLPGYAIYKWNRPAWAALWAISLFAFFHILIGPSSGYVSELTPEAWTAALGVFAAFGALSIGTWLYFRLRSTPVEPSPEAAAET